MSQYFPASPAIGFVFRSWGVVRFGFLDSASPSEDDVLDLDVANACQFNGSFELTQDGEAERFPCLAFPVSFQMPSSFTVDSEDYEMLATTITLDGIDYNLFIHATPTDAESLTITVA